MIDKSPSGILSTQPNSVHSSARVVRQGKPRRSITPMERGGMLLFMAEEIMALGVQRPLKDWCRSK